MQVSESESRSVMSDSLRLHELYTVHGILQARILEWVAFPFSRASSRPRNCTGVSCIAGRFFPNWVIREDLKKNRYMYMHVVVQSLSCVWLFVIPWTAACQASLSFTIPQSLLKLLSIELVMPSNHLILCCSRLLLPSIFPSIRVFSSESALHIRWPEYWSFSFSISPSVNILVWFPLGLVSLLSKGFSRVFSSTSINSSALSFLYGTILTFVALTTWTFVS